MPTSAETTRIIKSAKMAVVALLVLQYSFSILGLCLNTTALNQFVIKLKTLLQLEIFPYFAVCVMSLTSSQVTGKFPFCFIVNIVRMIPSLYLSRVLQK